MELAVLAVAVGGAILAVGCRDTLSAVVSLVGSSAALATYFYLLGAPYAAVFQSILAAGLIPVLFLLMASLTTGREPTRPAGTKAVVLGSLALAFLLSWAFLWNRIRAALSGDTAGYAAAFAESLWVAHSVDVLAVGLLTFVGVLAVVRLTAEKLDVGSMAADETTLDGGEEGPP